MGLYEGRALFVVCSLVLQPLSVPGNAGDFLAVKVGHYPYLVSLSLLIYYVWRERCRFVPGLPVEELEGSTRFFLIRAKNWFSFCNFGNIELANRK